MPAISPKKYSCVNWDLPLASVGYENGLLQEKQSGPPGKPGKNAGGYKTPVGTLN